MKKITAMAFFLTMLATISGCSSQDSNNEGLSTVVSTTTSAVTTTPATTQAPASTTTPIVTVGAVKNTQATTTAEAITTQNETTTQEVSSPEVNITSTIEANTTVNREDGNVYLSIKNVSEYPEFHSGTAIACATAVLNYYGFGCDKLEMLQYFQIDENGFWEDPNDYFLGNPENMNGYCSESVLKKAITSYWEANNISDYEIVDLSGSNFTDLYSEIESGNPVIFWTSVAMMRFDEQIEEFTLKDGSTFQFSTCFECMVLSGYDGGMVYVCDPLASLPEFYYYTEEDTIKAYDSLGKKAIVIHKKQ